MWEKIRLSVFILLYTHYMTQTISRPFHTWAYCSISPGLDRGRRRGMCTRHIRSHHHPQPELSTEKNRSAIRGIIHVQMRRNLNRDSTHTTQKSHSRACGCYHVETPRKSKLRREATTNSHISGSAPASIAVVAPVFGDDIRSHMSRRFFFRMPSDPTRQTVMEMSGDAGCLLARLGRRADMYGRRKRWWW